MKTYICTKVIHAVPARMVNGILWPEDLPLPKLPEGTDGKGSGQNRELIIQEGYLYTTSPEDRFPEFKTVADFHAVCRSTEKMTFGDALEAMKRGERVSRKGWNGKGQYVFLAYEPDFNTDADIFAIDNEAPVSDMLVLKTAQDSFQPGWLATQSDMLADDWYIVE